jgi:hypothetical protein
VLWVCGVYNESHMTPSLPRVLQSGGEDAQSCRKHDVDDTDRENRSGGEGSVVEWRQAVWEECLVPRLDPEEREGRGEERGRGGCDFTQDAALSPTQAPRHLGPTQLGEV